MHFTSVLVLCGILHAAVVASSGCNANNCLRAVRASAFPSRQGTADCSSYFLVTVTQATITSTTSNAHTTTATVEVLQETVSPTQIPAYASACSGSINYSSACSCLGVTHVTTTVAAATPTQTINTSAGYVLVSPSSCPPSAPTGALIGQSNSSFSAANGGLQYKQYSNSQFVIQDADSGPFFVDLSSSTMLLISDANGDSLIIYANGTFEAFVGDCELAIVGTWTDTSSSGKLKRNALEVRQDSSELCDDLQLYCNSRLGVLFSSLAGGYLCASIGAELGADIGGGIGFLGNILGPEVGIPTTILGVYLGGALGGFIAGRIGQTLCAGATGLLADSLCKSCPPTCSFGLISCNGGPCQDALSDPNNCGKCGNVCSSGLCMNGACSNPTCDGAACGGIQSCTGDCFCFEGSSTIGFCGENTPCDEDPPCSSDADCGLGSVCAVNTCCGSSICLAVCGGETVKRGMRFDGRTLARTNASYPAGVPPGF